MALISPQTIQLIRETARIEEVIGAHVTLKKEGPRLRGCCPFHNERTPSFSVNIQKQFFKCFGCGVSGDVFTFVMKHQNKTYPDAVHLLAQQYNIAIENTAGSVIDPELCKPEIRSRAALPEEVEGSWTFNRQPFTEATVKAVLSKYSWDYLLKTAKRLQTDVNTEFTAEERTKSALGRAADIFAQYHFHSLESYTIVKNGKAVEIRATEHFPIYIFDEGTWQKVYKPMEPEKRNRFLYHGQRPTDFFHGWTQICKAYTEREKQMGSEEEETDTKRKKNDPRVDEIIYCSGGSDGLNLAAIGLMPIWANSESSKLSEGTFRNWSGKAVKIYQLPDLDPTGQRTGHQLAMQHLDLYTIHLPAELKRKPVARGMGKDLRDFLRYFTAWDFFRLLKTAYPYRFWDSMPTYNKAGEFVKMGYTVRTKYMLNFLERNGFYRYKAENEKEGYIYIRIQDHIVTKIEAKDVRDFVNRFIEDRKLDAELMDTFLRTTQLNESTLSNLSFREVDFTDFDAHTQWMFFAESVLKITATGVEEYAPADCGKYVWADEVLPHEVERLPDFFTITKNEEDQFGIEIHEKNCLVLNYLINTSRVFWRDELETRLEGAARMEEKERERYIAVSGLRESEMPLLNGLPKEDWPKYRTENRFNIAGPLLTENEKRIQVLHLVNKIYGLGYLLHRHKNSSRAWCVWAMDNKLVDANESHGGSGKSIALKLLQCFMRTEYLEGRNAKITDNPHIWGNVTRHTDFIFIDDCSPYLRFDFFFPSITGPMNCNPKNTKQYTIPFNQVGKMGFASNYSPYGIDPSAERRILYMSFSDYYHYNRMGEYREERRVFDDFGKNLIDDFTDLDWNHTANFLAQCVAFYLRHADKVNPPMDSVNKRNLKSEMGDAFHAWMDVYMADPAHTNAFIARDEMAQNFYQLTKTKVTPQKFLKSVRAWCYYNGYELNPKEYQNSAGRIIRKHTVKGEDGQEHDTTREMFYLKKDAPTEPQTDPGTEPPTNPGSAEKLPF